ncbi:MAG: hypothetical protein ACT4OM_10025 [Actinomycetota bacterium]
MKTRVPAGGAAGSASESGRSPVERRSWRNPRSVGIGLLIAAVAAVAFGGLGKDVEQVRDSLDSGLKAHYEGDLVQARRGYLAVLQSDPDNKFANFNLGLVAHRENRRDEADRFYEASLASDRNFLPAMFNLAILKTSRGQNEAAEGLYREMIRRHPTRAEPYFNLGILLAENLDRAEEGEALIRTAVSMNPELRARVRQGIDLESPKDSPNG